MFVRIARAHAPRYDHLIKSITAPKLDIFTPCLLELDKSPVEEVVIKTIHNARVMLGSGFTSAISFGSVHRVDAFLKRGIECGDVLGPRLLAGGRDIGSTGSNADLHPDYAQLKIDGLGMITDGPWEVRKATQSS